MDIADACMSGTTSLTLSNANVTLTQSQMRVQRILCTGTLTANVAISFLAGVPGNFIIDNRTTGSFSISVITSAPGSTGITSPQNYRSFVFTDGTNVVLSDDGSQIPQPNSITNSQLAQIPSNTFKGNISVATESFGYTSFNNCVITWIISFRLVLRLLVLLSRTPLAHRIQVYLLQQIWP